MKLTGKKLDQISIYAKSHWKFLSSSFQKHAWNCLKDSHSLKFKDWFFAIFQVALELSRSLLESTRIKKLNFKIKEVARRERLTSNNEKF